MSYSPALTYFLDRLSGFSTNIFRLETQNNDTATANKILRFSLPANALLNMRSFALHFNAKTTASGQGARLPAKIDTLIERVEVTAGGVQLSQGLNYYNVLRHAKDALYGDKTNSVCGHPDIVRTISPRFARVRAHTVVSVLAWQPVRFLLRRGYALRGCMLSKKHENALATHTRTARRHCSPPFSFQRCMCHFGGFPRIAIQANDAARRRPYGIHKVNTC